MQPKQTDTGFIRRILQTLRVVSPKSKKCESITQTIQRMDKMEERVGQIEAVTMSWTAADLTLEEQKQLGLFE